MGFLLIVLLAATGCGGQTQPTGEENTLTGTVVLNGQPADYSMVVAIGPNGQEATGPRLADGSYNIINPPTGMLKFKFAAGPPIPGGPPAAKTGNVPAKYLSETKELTFEYAGGNQVYNIELKP
jgi:hypothetical protein